MWLLSTDRAKLETFNGPEHVPGGYVIFSHVWSQYLGNLEDRSVLSSGKTVGHNSALTLSKPEPSIISV